jgi:baseplate J-like protein
VDVPAVAVDAGADSTGIAIGEINVLVDPIPYVASVENTSVTSGGVEKEDDDSLTERAYIAPSNVSVAGPVDLYEYFARSWRSDITAAKPICEDGYTVYIYFLLKDGRLPTEEECRELERYFADIKKPMGDLVVGVPPEEVPYSINLTYYIASSNVKNAGLIQKNVEKAVEEYKTWQRKIGLDIDPAELIMRVREAGAKRPRLTAPVDTVVSKIQVSKVTECKITYGGIEDD